MRKFMLWGSNFPLSVDYWLKCSSVWKEFIIFHVILYTVVHRSNTFSHISCTLCVANWIKGFNLVVFSCSWCSHGLFINQHLCKSYTWYCKTTYKIVFVLDCKVEFLQSSFSCILLDYIHWNVIMVISDMKLVIGMQ